MPLAPARLDALRESIRRMEAADRLVHGHLPFDVASIDAYLPGGGLAL